ncbi:hypothetical protein [Vreelandella profundi]
MLNTVQFMQSKGFRLLVCVKGLI